MKKKLLIAAIALLFLPQLHYGQAPSLGSLAGFVLFTTTGAVANTGVSQIAGNIGTNAGAVTGFDPPSIVAGTIHIANAVTAQGITDLNTAYAQLNSTVPTNTTHTPAFGSGETLFAGIYSIGAAGSVAGVLNLDAQGNANAIFIFKFGGEFTTGAGTTINLTNGAMPGNIFWIAEGAIPMAASTVMKGTLIANNGAISLAAGGSLEGRMFSTTGAVSINGVILALPAGVTLPVRLVAFKAISINNAVALHWTTASEFAAEKFDLQRSADGLHFYPLISLPATNTNFVKSYTWSDNTPLTGASFYRLKMIDINATFTYSTILRVEIQAPQSSSIYPNPITGHQLHLQLKGHPRGEQIISLYNLQGGKMMRTKIVHDGHDRVWVIRLDKNITSAAYYLEIKGPDHHKQTFKVFVQ